MARISVGILGTGAALPEQILTNEDLERMVDTSDEWIRERTGIRERRIADPETATSDLALVAARRALENAGVPAGAVDLVICATVTPDRIFCPPAACIIQDKLGAANAGAMDINAACSGFLYSLASAVSMIQSGLMKYVLVIGADTLSRITDYTDRNTCVLFGDGAGAAVLGPVGDGRGFHSFVLGSDGSGADVLVVPGGGSRRPASKETVENREHFIKMNGKEVFKFAVRVMGTAAEEALEKAGKTVGDIDFLIPHQANLRIIDAAAKRLNLPMEKVYVNVDRYGNMSSASIPVALDEASKRGQIQPGDTLVLVGFGGGLTWGASVLTW
jgi:3-oxoacyl-[acyl-carrier-protein] synthase-3